MNSAISDDELHTFSSVLVQEYLKRDAYLSDQVHGEHVLFDDEAFFRLDPTSSQASQPGVCGVKVRTPAGPYPEKSWNIIHHHPVGEYFAAWTMDLCSKDPQTSIFVHPGWWNFLPDLSDASRKIRVTIGPPKMGELTKKNGGPPTENAIKKWAHCIRFSEGNDEAITVYHFHALMRAFASLGYTHLFYRHPLVALAMYHLLWVLNMGISLARWDFLLGKIIGDIYIIFYIYIGGATIACLRTACVKYSPNKATACWLTKWWLSQNRLGNCPFRAITLFSVDAYSCMFGKPTTRSPI